MSLCELCGMPVKDRNKKCLECKDRYTKYMGHKARALAYKIEWRFTYETWLKVWMDSGKWNLRGRRSGEFVMARPYDKGPYSPENVVIVTCRVNSSLRGERWKYYGHVDL